MQNAAYQPSTASWQSLAHLRKRGQRPLECVIVTDRMVQRRNLELSGAFALPFPGPREVYLTVGLDVVVIADYSEKAVEIAQAIAAANPRYLATFWRGQGLQTVIA